MDRPSSPRRVQSRRAAHRAGEAHDRANRNNYFDGNRKMRTLLKSLLTDTRGNVALTAALAMPVFLAGVGAAVDYSRASAVRTNLQTALDAAVLSGVASSDVASEQIAMANKVFGTNVNNFSSSSTNSLSASFSVSGLVLSGQATASMENLFGALLGSERTSPTAKAAATKSTIP